MAHHVLANLITEDAMVDMTLTDSEYMIKNYLDPVLFFKTIVEKVRNVRRINVKELKIELHDLDINNFKYHIPDANKFPTKIYKDNCRQVKY